MHRQAWEETIDRPKKTGGVIKETLRDVLKDMLSNARSSGFTQIVRKEFRAASGMC